MKKLYAKVGKAYDIRTERYYTLVLINNYSPKAKWLLVNIHRDEVEVNIQHNHWAWGE